MTDAERIKRATESLNAYIATKPPKPKRAELYPENIPDELKIISHWCLWKIEFKNGKWTKPPYQLDGTNASSTNASTLCSFDDALFEYHKGGYDGIGFAIFPDDEFVGFDWDGSIVDGVVNEDVEKHVRALDSYTEISPSGNGLRAFALGVLPEGARKNTHRQWECYGDGRYLTVTGNKYHGSEVQTRYEEIADLHKEMFPRDYEPAPEAPKMPDGPRCTEDEVMRRVYSSSACDTVVALLAHADGGTDRSSGDLAVCNHLAYFSGRNAVVMDEIFRQSKRMRLKWDEMRGANTYGNITIQKAITGCAKVYAIGARQGLHPIAAQEEGEFAPIYTLRTRHLRELNAEDVEPKTVLYGRGDFPIMRSAELSILHGREGVAKSWAAMGLVWSLVSGVREQFMDLSVCIERVSVVHVTSETDVEETRKRYNMIKAVLGGEEGDNLNLSTVEDTEGMDILRPEVVDGIIHRLRETNASFLVMDPLADLWIGREENEDYGKLKAKLRKIMNATKVGILVIAHEPKGAGGFSVSDENALRGGTALRAAARSVLRIKPAVGADKDIMEVVHTKSNIGRKAASRYYHIGVPWMFEMVGRPTAMNAPSKVEERLGIIMNHLDSIYPKTSTYAELASLVDMTPKTIGKYLKEQLKSQVHLSGTTTDKTVQSAQIGRKIDAKN